MLEPFDVGSAQFKPLISHFDDLNRAHEAVLKAKRQVEITYAAGGRLRPPQNIDWGSRVLGQCRDSLPRPLWQT